MDRLLAIGHGPRLEGKKRFELPPDVPEIGRQVDVDFPPVNELDIQTRKFLRANLHVWALMYLMVRTMVNKRVRFSMKMLVEVARWQHINHTVDPNQDKFKLSNSYTAYIARLITYFFPGVLNLITTKEVRNGQEDC